MNPLGEATLVVAETTEQAQAAHPPARSHPARTSSSAFRTALAFSAADDSKVAPMPNRPSLVPKTIASQGLFLIVPLPFRADRR
jgi:hypothetical protein